MTRQNMQKLLNFLLFNLTKTDFQGTENVPTEGPLMIVTNHLSRVDIPLLLANPIRTEITALAAKKYQSRPFFRWILDSCGVIYLDRTTADFQAFREAKKVLKAGVALGISPEGTRSHTGALQKAKHGAAMLAMQLQIPIVPVGLQGTEAAFQTLLKFRRPHLVARFGQVFHLPVLGKEDREGQLETATDEIMCRIAQVLPEKYRGYYSNHPRLQALNAME